MRLRYHRRRLADVAAGARMSRELTDRERWPRERLVAHQQERLRVLVEHAKRNSRFWAERLEEAGDGPVDLERLPVLTKAELMERFDDALTDRRLERDRLAEWVERAERDDLYLDRYRVMSTSGSSGRKGLFVYDEPGWQGIVAGFFRYNAIAGIRPRLPRVKIAAIGGAAPTHMSRQISATAGIGVHRVADLPVTLPLGEMVEALNRFEPDFVNAYPSVAVRLADEQRAGRLRLSLRGMSTSSEVRTPAMTERIAEAFGVRPFDLYGTTEGLWGCECEEHDGIHLFEDLVIVENVDAEGRAVPAGEPGSRLLVTNLSNLVQPIIRLEITDSVTLAPAPCDCGRTLCRTAAVDGRSDDVLELPGGRGRGIAVHPMQFAVVTRDRDVREFQVRRRPDGLQILVVPGAGAGAELEQRVAAAVRDQLAGLGVRGAEVTVERRDELARTAGGKLQVVVDAV